MACRPVLVLAATVAAAGLATTVAAQLGRITIENRQFKDPEGRVRIFHGVNDVNKVEPYLSEFTDAELTRMETEWGYNILRLGFSWEGYERERGVKDPNYLAETSTMVTRLAEHGIYALIDSHQDLFSRMYCGNGFPDWAVRVSPAAEQAAPFPIPVLGGDVVYEVDPVTGHIPWYECQRSYWGTYYFSVVTGSIFHNFYTDVDGILTAYVDMWSDIATYFAGRSEVVGLDILNEPFPGNIYSDPRLLFNATYADDSLLNPLYARVHEVVRQVDNETRLFFEPHVTNTEILPRKSGLVAPGGPEYANRDVYSFHWYCAEQANYPDYCDEFLDISFNQREADAVRINVPKMLTEFGWLYDSVDDIVANNTAILNRASEDFVSWITWAYARLDDDERVAASLVRPYARAIAGTPVRTAFDFDTKDFVFEYEINPAITAPTEVFLPLTLHYLTGANITVTPADAVTWNQPQPHLVWITPTAGATAGELITVNVVAA